MLTIDDHRLRFGEFAGPLVHGARVFDWLLISTQEVADAFEYSFETILADDGIPYAPVVASGSISRYPTIGETIEVAVVPIAVGTSSVELCYEISTDAGESLATARILHVTIGPDGSARALPETTRSAFESAVVDRDPQVGPPAADPDSSGEEVSFTSSFPIRSPHIEGAELAYFEEYPRFADVAIEEHLEANGTSLPALAGEKQPYRIRTWRWEFTAPVLFGSTLDVAAEVRSVDSETIQLDHRLSSNGQTNIAGITEYGCFDRSGSPTTFDEAMLAPFTAAQTQ